MEKLLDLPLEIKLMVLQYCSLQTCKNLLIISRNWRDNWYDSVLDKQMWESRVKKGYYRNKIQGKQQSNGAMLFKIASQHGLAALEKEALFNEPEAEAAYNKIKLIYHSSTKDRQEQLIQVSNESEIAALLILYHHNYWDFISNQEVRASFIQDVITQWPAAIYYALENKVLRKQWLPLLIPAHVIDESKYAAICDIVEAGGKSVAWLWSSDAELYGLLRTMQEEGAWWLYLSVYRILQNGGEEVALLWSTDPKLYALLQIMVKNSQFLCLSIQTIIKAGGKQVALLWSSVAELRNIIASIEIQESFQLRCLDMLIEIGGVEARQACLEHPTLARNLASTS